ncbi:MAG: response regulator [Elusimicrobiota bacterium]
MTNGKILIVDDDFAFAQFAQIILESLGYSVAVSLEGGAAQAAAIREKPDLVLMDMRLNDMTGTQAIALLKANPETKHIPIVLCSMTHSAQEIKDARIHGAVDFLPKPLKSEQLSRVIRKALGEASA